ncbi:MAG: endonuclease domain-containing protein [Anaerolineae bacterium]|nr:endonuclease domain-containing protein [Anaerolineae bacterium]
MSDDPDEKPHLFDAAPVWWWLLKPAARRMRRAPTEAERVLWKYLRDRQVGGFKFRRQYAVDRFILDFYCHETRLAVEVDGSIHARTRHEDAARDARLAAYGIRVLRVRNEDVLNNIAAVLAEIRDTLTNGLPHP